MLDTKGVGEGGTVVATPTVMNAILDALAPLGATDLPMSVAGADMFLTR